MSAYAVLTRASYRASIRDKTTIFFTFAFPLLFLLVFGLIFQGQSVEGTGRSYIDYIAPGVLSWGVGNAALFGVAFTFMQWRNDDILRLIRMTPTKLRSVIASRFVVAVVIGVLQSVLFIGIAMLPIFGLRLGSTWPLAFLVLVLGITAFLAIGMVVGAVADTAEAVAAVANCVMVPMAFLSGAFYPLDLMPGWLQSVSRLLPLRYLNDGIAGTLSGRGDLGELAIACGALAVFTAAFSLVAVKMFRWSSTS
jgi:ABC-2 type transport system permease protein